jgi:hypothetical protein
MTKDDQNLLIKLLLLGGAAYAVYELVIVPAGNAESGVSNAASTIAQDLGLAPDPNAAAVNTATSTPGTPFDPNFYASAAGGPTILTGAAASAYATTIYNALNTWFFNDFNAVYGVFTSLTTQSQVSFLAHVFQQTYNKDLLTWLEYANGNEPAAGTGSNILTGALLGGGLTDAQVQQIITYVNALPNT